MKKLIVILFAALMSVAQLAAQSYIYGYTAEGITLQDTLVAGAIKTATISGYSNAAHSGVHYAELLMPANVSNSFAGCRITSVSFCPFLTSKTVAKIVISTEIGGTPLYQQTVNDVKSHEWSRVELTTPFVIPANETLYIGYCIAGAAGDYPLGYYYTSAPGKATAIDPVLDYIGCNNNKGTFTTGLLDTQTYTARRQTANWMLYATIEGDIPSKGISIDNVALSRGEYIHPSDDQTITTTVTNVATDTIKNFSMSVEFDGHKMLDSIQSVDIAPFWEKQLTFSLSTLGSQLQPLTAGLHTLSITVDKPDGGDNSYTGDHTMKRQFLVYTDSVQKTVLIEHFTTARCVNCVAGEAKINEYIDNSLAKDNHIQVNHHSGYTYDALTTDADKAYEWFYGTEKGGSMWAPANMVDRRDFTVYGAKGYGGRTTTGPVHGTSGAKTDSLINVAYRTPGFITLEIAPILKNGTDIRVRIKGTCLYELPDADKKRLNVFVLEDSVAYPQADGDSIIQNYRHNNVFRCALTGTWGEAGVISGKSIDRTYTCSLDTAWNAENLRVVAFVADYDSLDNTDCQVYQASQANIHNVDVAELPFVLDESIIENSMFTNVKGYNPHGWMYMSKYGAWIYSLSTGISGFVGKAYLYTYSYVHLPAGKVYLSTAGTAIGDDVRYEVYIAPEFISGIAMKDYGTLVGNSGRLRNVLNTGVVDTTVVELDIPEEGDYVVGIRPLTEVKYNQMTIASLKITKDNPTGIVSVMVSDDSQNTGNSGLRNSEAFNLSGQRVGKNARGIVIVNGIKRLRN